MELLLPFKPNICAMVAILVLVIGRRDWNNFVFSPQSFLYLTQELHKKLRLWCRAFVP